VSILLKYKKTLLTIVVIGVVAVVAMMRSSGNKNSGDRQRGLGGRSGEMRMSVRGIIVLPVPLDENIEITGSVLANEEVQLRSEVAGKVTRILFAEGSHVKKGDLLVKINDADLQAQLQKAESQLKFLSEKEARQKKLREVNGVSQEQYEEALNSLNGVRAEIALLNAQVQKTEVRAPFDGVVGIRFISEGSYITTATVIASMQDISSVKVDFSIPEKYVSHVRKGNKVYFSIEGSSRRHEGTVYAIESKIDPTTRTLRIRAIARNEQGLLVPGSFARVDLVLGRQESTLLVPTQAVIPEIDGQKVFLVRGGRATLTPVVTGMRLEEKIQILKGVVPNDTLLTTGLLQLRSGLPVTVTLEQ